MNINPDANVYSGSHDASPYGLASKRSLEKKYLNFSFGNVLDGVPDHEDVSPDGWAHVSSTGDKILPDVVDSSGKESLVTINQPESGKSHRWLGASIPLMYADKNARAPLVYTAYGDSGRKIAQGVMCPDSEDATAYGTFDKHLKNSIERFSVKFIGNEEGVSVRVRDFFGFFSRNDLEKMAKYAKVKMPLNVFSRVRVYLNARIIK